MRNLSPKSRRFDMRAGIVVVVMASLLSGCGSLLNPGEPPARVQLTVPAPTLTNATDASRRTPIIVSKPRAARDIDTDRIALLFNDREVRALKGYRWSASAPSLLQQALIDGLSTTGAFASVTDESVSVANPLRILCDLQQFTLHYGPQSPDSKASAPPTATIQATFRLFDLNKGRVLATLPLTVEHAALSTEVPALMAAQEAALGETVSRVANWVVGAVPAQRR